jgi:hypothetical protein
MNERDKILVNRVKPPLEDKNNVLNSVQRH